MDGRVAADDLFDVLRIDILTSDDEQVFLPADDVQFILHHETEVPRAVPTVVERIACEIGTIEVAVKKAIGLDLDFTDTIRRDGFGDDAKLLIRQQAAR